MKINLSSIRDEAFVQELSREAAALEQAALEGEQAILRSTEIGASCCR